MAYTVTLERGTDGGYLAWVHELPGCCVRAPTRADVEAKIGPAIAEFLTWARGGRPVGAAVDYVIAAEVDTPVRGAEGDSNVLLEPDTAALTLMFWTQVERWLKRSRTELLELVRGLTDDELTWQPTGAPRSVRGHVVHIAFVEFMYAAWTFDLQSPKGLAEFLGWTRRIVMTRMRRLARADKGRLTVAEWSGAPRPEPWTARKTARRLAWHERLHLRGMQRLLAKTRAPHTT